MRRLHRHRIGKARQQPLACSYVEAALQLTRLLRDCLEKNGAAGSSSSSSSKGSGKSEDEDENDDEEDCPNLIFRPALPSYMGNTPHRIRKAFGDIVGL